MEKKNTFKTILIILLILLFGLGLFGVLYKELNKMEEVNKKDENQEKIKTSEEIAKLIPENDDTVLSYGNIFELVNNAEIDFNKNFQNVKSTLNDTEFTFNCTAFLDPNTESDFGGEVSGCSGVDIKVNNNTVFHYYKGISVENNPFVLMTDKYIIFNSGYGINEDAYITIYDKNGNKLDTVNQYTVEYGDIKNENNTKVDLQMKLNNNILYYFVDESVSEPTYIPKVSLMTYDLESKTNTKTKTFENVFASQIKH